MRGCVAMVTSAASTRPAAAAAATSVGATGFTVASIRASTSASGVSLAMRCGLSLSISNDSWSKPQLPARSSLLADDDLVVLDHLGPARDLGGEELGEHPRRGQLVLQSLLAQGLLDRRLAQRLGHGHVHPRDDVARGLRRRQQPPPGLGIERGDAELG